MSLGKRSVVARRVPFALALVGTIVGACAPEVPSPPPCSDQLASIQCKDGFKPELAGSTTDCSSGNCVVKETCTFKCVPEGLCSVEGRTQCAGSTQVQVCRAGKWEPKEDCSTNGGSSVCVTSADGSGGCDRCPDPAETRCPGVGCRNLTKDPANCGTCGTKCTSKDPHGHGVCQGTCKDTCDDGYRDCGGSCVDIASETANCGGCGHVCGSANGTPACVAGKCQFNACKPGFAHCTLDDAAGCDTDVTTNSNCGTCGNVCGPSTTCDAKTGRCRTCEQQGLTTCGTGAAATCVDTLHDVNNCGGCGRPSCPGGAAAACDNGTCRKWPFGSDGPLVVTANMTIPAGSTKDYSLLDVKAGATLTIDAGTASTAPWTVIGVRGALTVNGNIKVLGGIGPGGSPSTGNAPADDGVSFGEPLSWTLTQMAGGSGGSAGWNCQGTAHFRLGGAQAFGNGGGGGGDTMVENTGSGPCPQNCSNVAGTLGYDGFSAMEKAGGQGGADWSSAANTNGGAGATTVGSNGQDGINLAGPYAGRSGGGGGFRGRHGGLLYLKVIGSMGGTGKIDASGGNGGNGGKGGAANTITSGSCGGFRYDSGGGPGGGGAGGSGGKVVVRYNGDANAVRQLINVAGGSPGTQPINGGGNTDGVPAQAGALGDSSDIKPL